MPDDYAPLRRSRLGDEGSCARPVAGTSDKDAPLSCIGLLARVPEDSVIMCGRKLRRRLVYRAADAPRCITGHCANAAHALQRMSCTLYPVTHNRKKMLGILGASMYEAIRTRSRPDAGVFIVGRGIPSRSLLPPGCWAVVAVSLRLLPSRILRERIDELISERSA